MKSRLSSARLRGIRWARGSACRCLALLGVFALAAPVQAQLDPTRRRVIQAGYTLPLHEHGPLAAYGFYYHNQPGFLRSNLTLRLAVVPVYLDAELGARDLLGPHTDLGIGLSGGGFSDSYAEIRQGDYKTGESFLGHGFEFNSSLYRRLNPQDRLPASAILRGGVHSSFYTRDDDTDPDFVVPEDQYTLIGRAGLRLGGREPYISPRLAGELSFWYEGLLRLNDGHYGFDNDRQIQSHAHRFWTRALLAYTLESQHHFEVSLTAGAALNPDRLSAFRLGGSLPFWDEFPLMLPGYHIEELSADHFALLYAQYFLPLDPGRRFFLLGFGSTGAVDYVPGLEQDGHWHSGLGGGLIYQSSSGAWLIGAGYACGFNAIREDDGPAHTLTVVVQYDLDSLLGAGGRPFWEPAFSSKIWRGLFRRIGGG